MSDGLEALRLHKPLPAYMAPAWNVVQETTAPTGAALWAAMTLKQRRLTIHAMTRYGGGFATRLAEAWSIAGDEACAILAAAFPDLLKEYAPGSEPFTWAAQLEALWGDQS